jgi:acid phosphatase
MPKTIADADSIYIRATPIPRALESVQQTFTGLYPRTTRTANFPPPTIITRSPGEETLYPNDNVCRRFAQLARAYAQRTADRWKGSQELEYVDQMIRSWMPGMQNVAVDSHPRLSGILDTIAATKAHGPQTRLPQPFNDPSLFKVLERIGVEEWFQGYNESQEYRKLGIGGLAGDIVTRMVSNAEVTDRYGIEEVGGDGKNHGVGRGGEKRIKLALSGCHDTTVGGLLASLGAFNMDSWPPYTSHIAVELFRHKDSTSSRKPESQRSPRWESKFMLWLREGIPKSGYFRSIARKPLTEMTTQEKKILDGYFVRLRYNDEVVKLPGCKPVGKHMDGDDSFCTLVR